MIEIKAGQVGLKCRLENEHGIPQCDSKDGSFQYGGERPSASACIMFPHDKIVGWIVCPDLIIQPYKYDEKYNHPKPTVDAPPIEPTGKDGEG